LPTHIVNQKNDNVGFTLCHTEVTQTIKGKGSKKFFHHNDCKWQNTNFEETK
jgi:hypothetical protein